MKFKNGNIDDITIINIKKYTDERGSLIETYRLDTLPDNIKPVMSYASYTKPGITRGPHEHKFQTDIFSFLGPANFKLYLWDNRKSSKTYRNYLEITAGIDNPTTIIIPPGIVHGYKNISTDIDGMVLNYPDRLYKGKNKKDEIDEIRHEDNSNTIFKI